MDFTITEEEFDRLLAASQSGPYIVAGGMPPPDPQEAVNRIWKEIAEKYGVVWDSIHPVDEKARLMRGTPSPTD